MIYLDNAASSHPKPAEVIRACIAQLRENGANPGRSGHKMSLNASETVFATRVAMAQAFGTDEERVIFTKNTTEALNLALKGLLNKGDHAVISDLEHNSVLRPLTELAEKGITFSVCKTEAKDEQTVKNLAALLNEKTRLVLCTHASNVTGQILPVREIGTICRQRGILFGVDGAQTAGTEFYNLRRDPIDFICVPGHKGLLGPQGTGALLLAHPLPLRSLTAGGTGIDSLEPKQTLSFPEGYESGTLNTPGLAGLREGVLFVQRHRDLIRAREERLRKLFLHLTEPLREFQILGQGEHFVGTVAITHETDHSEEVCRWLDHCGICTRGGFHCSALAHKALGTEGRGALRVSFGYANTEKDVHECVKFLKKYQNNRCFS